MAPTEINILVAILAIILGVAITRIYYADQYFKGLNKGLSHMQGKVGESYERGFRDGVDLVDNEDAEGDAEIGELLKKGYLTWDELNQLEELDFLDDIPDDVFVR